MNIPHKVIVHYVSYLALYFLATSLIVSSFSITYSTKSTTLLSPFFAIPHDQAISNGPLKKRKIELIHNRKLSHIRVFKSRDNSKSMMKEVYQRNRKRPSSSSSSSPSSSSSSIYQKRIGFVPKKEVSLPVTSTIKRSRAAFSTSKIKNKPLQSIDTSTSDAPNSKYTADVEIPTQKEKMPKKKDNLERLHKIMARAGISSRREAEMMILDGRVSVNGQLVTELGTKFHPREDKILVDGKALSLPDMREVLWVMLNKPKDVIATVNTDATGRSTLLQFLPKSTNQRLVPVGSMDRDGTGLLLLTNDIGWIHPLTHPSYGIHRRFDIVVEGIFSVGDIDNILKNCSMLHSVPPFEITISDYNKRAKQTTLDIALTKCSTATIEAVVDALGSKLVSCKRTEFGPLRLQSLKKGDWRLLTTSEVNKLKSSCIKDHQSIKKQHGDGQEDMPLDHITKEPLARFKNSIRRLKLRD